MELNGVNPGSFSVLCLRSRTIGFRERFFLPKENFGRVGLGPFLVTPFLACAFFRRR